MKADHLDHFDSSTISKRVKPNKVQVKVHTVNQWRSWCLLMPTSHHLNSSREFLASCSRKMLVNTCHKYCSPIKTGVCSVWRSYHPRTGQCELHHCQTGNMTEHLQQAERPLYSNPRCQFRPVETLAARKLSGSLQDLQCTAAFVQRTGVPN